MLSLLGFQYIFLSRKIQSITNMLDYPKIFYRPKPFPVNIMTTQFNFEIKIHNQLGKITTYFYKIKFVATIL